MRRMLKFSIITLFLATSYFLAKDASAIPSPLPHLHTTSTIVPWKEPGSPNLPWTDAVANQWNHNHLTSDPFNNAPNFIINKAWDNRTLHSSLAGQAQFGHGMILPNNAVRYGWTNDVPNNARDVVEAAFNSWISEATTQFNAKKDPLDILAIDFDRADTGTREITIDFDPNLAAYGSTEGSTITFLTTPNPTFTFASLNEIFNLGVVNPAGWEMSFDNGTNWSSVLSYNANWSFDGSPDVVIADQDIDFRDPTNNVHEVIGGLDIFDLTEMDFATIALHEVGHVIGLGHPGDPTASLMRTNIFRNAIFGNTMQIDNSSALGVAIDYTYTTPEPSTLLLMVSGFIGMAGIGWRRGRRGAKHKANVA